MRIAPLVAVFSAAILAGLLADEPAEPKPAAKATVLVELFTSEGCSSCPPADRVLGELAKEDGVIALSFHVDYWDYLGWKDPFASPEATARQRAYADRFESSRIYTPQMVVDGRDEFVGSDRRRASDAIMAAANRPKASLEVQTAPAVDEQVRVSIHLSDPPESSKGKTCSVFVALSDNSQSSQAKRGENAGRTLDHVCVVRHFEVAGTWEPDKAAEWSGEAVMRAPATPAHVVVWLQSQEDGAILGAARVAVAAGATE